MIAEWKVDGGPRDKPVASRAALERRAVGLAYRLMGWHDAPAGFANGVAGMIRPRGTHAQHADHSGDGGSGPAQHWQPHDLYREFCVAGAVLTPPPAKSRLAQIKPNAHG